MFSQGLSIRPRTFTQCGLIGKRMSGFVGKQVSSLKEGPSGILNNTNQLFFLMKPSITVYLYMYDHMMRIWS